MPAPRKHLSNAQRQRAYRERQNSARTAQIQAKGLPPSAPIPTMPSTARWNALVQMAHDLLRAAHQEMEAYRGDRSDIWQESEKGETFQLNLESIGQAIDCLAETT